MFYSIIPDLVKMNIVTKLYVLSSPDMLHVDSNFALYVLEKC